MDKPEQVDGKMLPALSARELERLFDTAQVVPPARRRVTFWMDRDVHDWFRAQGKGHQARMNAVLRAYVAMREKRET